jgi:hypothetical protein
LTTHDPRPVKKAMIQLWVEIMPAREDYAMKYVGDSVHELGSPDGSYERVTPEDIAMEVMRRVGGRDLDGMWLVTGVKPVLASLVRHQPTEPELDLHILQVGSRLSLCQQWGGQGATSPSAATCMDCRLVYEASGDSATFRADPGAPVVRLDDPLFDVKVVAALASPRAGICDTCKQPMHWLNAPTGGWWAHDTHPDDGHDARAAQRHTDARGGCICQTLSNPPCHWCSGHCCAEHVDHCLAGFPAPCCDKCPDEN